MQSTNKIVKMKRKSAQHAQTFDSALLKQERSHKQTMRKLDIKQRRKVKQLNKFNLPD